MEKQFFLWRMLAKTIRLLFLMTLVFSQVQGQNAAEDFKQAAN
jgi:hypothetical protein